MTLQEGIGDPISIIRLWATWLFGISV